MPLRDEEISGEEIGHRTVTDAAVMAFGGLTGDFAQMHFDHSFGPAAGMGGTIAHGLLSASWSLGAFSLYAPERLGLGEPGAYITHYEVRFGRMVFLGDRFSLRFGGEDPDATRFEVLNQEGQVTCSGALGVSRTPRTAELPAPLEIEDWSLTRLSEPLYADQMLAEGPRGVSLGRTFSEADIAGWTNFTGELNPLYLNEPFASEGPFGARIVPPMLSFCIGFGDYLRTMLRVPMPRAGFAGHLGDSWRFHAPVFVGDTLRTRHKPVGYEPSKSRRGMGIVRFGLQLENQHGEIVQDGEVVMMIPASPG